MSLADTITANFKMNGFALSISSLCKIAFVLEVVLDFRVLVLIFLLSINMLHKRAFLKDFNIYCTLVILGSDFSDSILTVHVIV